MEQPPPNTNAKPESNGKLQAPAPLHQSDADEDDENVKQLGDCSAIYLSLQECLIATDRNWKSCQKEVQALRKCSERRGK